jgi:hypothetical protein
MNDPPLSSSKKLILLTPRLLCSLHTMSLVKAPSKALKDCECKKITLFERPQIPYVPKKGCVQETVSAFKAERIKTLIGKCRELQVPIWHSGMRKTFLIHVGSALEAIKKRVTSRPTKMQRKPTWKNVNW